MICTFTLICNLSDYLTHTVGSIGVKLCVAFKNNLRKVFSQESLKLLLEIEEVTLFRLFVTGRHFLVMRYTSAYVSHVPDDGTQSP